MDGDSFLGVRGRVAENADGATFEKKQTLRSAVIVAASLTTAVAHGVRILSFQGDV